ncbi:CinA domain protein [Beutenbergia cavernae DSM 12333]|uniref:CinA domain protein n=1 Tax=Beutenbergia cavernae (strain ATCC BAA-8 / DSM 12333 / CCUG 43141 / JCM 11478 / NBRC 16432 / NCIMB 13614 / HKI 0122) TaxID=471853 RepID=C5BWP0_BEUC1|nr:nicotinamide-nucleotide amidohydrolase family protein [Beutenbergia cavernae]ACQ80706.1 CinA domain protein [Beutenbergia cavernae DSM 12333]
MTTSTSRPMHTAAARLVARLRAAGLTIGLAESLTGGALTSALVEVPGASAVVRGGVVAYATDVKHGVLGVPAGLLDEHGPVHPDVALAMARGICFVLASDVGVATTGVAGPGPADGRPAGVVYVAAYAAGRGVVRELRLAGTRPLVRSATTAAALALALATVDDVA